MGCCEPWRAPNALVEIADAPGLPVTLAEFKAQARIDADDEDALLAVYLEAATAQAEAITNRVIVGRAVTLRASDFPPRPDQALHLPGGIVRAVTSVSYADTGSVDQAIALEDVEIESAARAPAALRLLGGGIWPVVRPWGRPVAVEYLAGWADDGASPPDLGANVPAGIKTAIMMMAAEMHARREVAVIGAAQSAAMVGPAALLAPWRLLRVA